MEVMRSSETSVHIRTARCYIPEDGNIRLSLLGEGHKLFSLIFNCLYPHLSLSEIARGSVFSSEGKRMWNSDIIFIIVPQYLFSLGPPCWMLQVEALTSLFLEAQISDYLNRYILAITKFLHSWITPIRFSCLHLAVAERNGSCSDSFT
jgi:hypothetical protein